MQTVQPDEGLLLIQRITDAATLCILAECIWGLLVDSHHLTVSLGHHSDSLTLSHYFCLPDLLGVITTEAGTWRAPEPGRFSILHFLPLSETLDDWTYRYYTTLHQDSGPRCFEHITQSLFL